MVESNVFELASIIKSACGDPSDMTDAIWKAGYRKPERTSEEMVVLTIDSICAYVGLDLPYECWPKSLNEVLEGELNELFGEVLHDDEKAHPGKPNFAYIAKSILAAGYRKESTNG
ncbi:TPA: hypothetical protein U5D55_000208 [Yersinia enterocolitica]|nr:hypothetical protein [Yersinia enterocolitica]HDL8134504.1 hypothetical protein [Yersinia enterocolitica]HEN3403470.1 hypothetical protein [Yersinia enterocolitica]